MSQGAHRDGIRSAALAAAAGLLLWPPCGAVAQQPPAQQAGPAAAAGDIADFFRKVGDQIYEDCIFELSEEQVELQAALTQAYIKQGATSAAARQLAVKQIQPPEPSERCEQIRRSPDAPTSSWTTTLKKPPSVVARTKPAPEPKGPTIALSQKKGLPQWDCAANVDYVTVHIKGFERKLTGGEICNPFEDVVREVPDSLKSFRLGYTIQTGRLFVIADDPKFNGKTIAWAISGRDICRNNPDPDCLAAKAVGPLPPGQYSFGGDKAQRVTWGPRTKGYVVGIYLKELWNRERFTAKQTAAILARGNIAIHARLKGEMSEACLGLEPKGWAYVASLIKDGRATGLNAYLNEPHPQVAENPPVVVASSFSLTSLFK